METQRRKQHNFTENNMWALLWHGLPMAALLLWGAFCITNSLWYDEAYSASMVSLPWKRLIYITATDDHSPFYYVLLKSFYHLCGGGTHFWALKLMSVLFMLGYMLLGKYYVAKLFDRKISVYFMLFSLLMPIFSVQAGNVRMYAVALFFLTLTGLSAYDIFREPTRKKWIVFCIASIGTVYCHTFALIQTFLFYLLFFAVILICHKKELIKGYFISGFTVALVFSPWLAVTIRQFVLRMRYDDGSTAELATLYSVMDYCKEWFSAVETPIGIVVLLGMALCLVLSYGAVDWVRQNHNIAPAIAFGTFALTGIVGGMISATVNNCFMGRYAFPGMGFVMLWYAVGFAQITENTKGKSRKIWAAGLLGTAGLCFLLQYTSEIRLEYDDGLETYENFVEEYMTENDAIIGPYTHTIFLNVYHPELHYYTIAYKLYSLPFVNTEALSSYSQLDTYDNLWYICFQGCRIGQESQFVQIFLNLLLILLGGNQTHQNGLFGLCLRYDKFFHATKIYYFNYLRIFANIFTNINQLSYEKENLASIQMRCRLYGIPIRTTIYPVTSFKSIYMGKFCAK